MADHHPDAAAEVAYKIAAYVTTDADARNWGPHRWAYEAVSVILHDEGAAHDVLAVMHDRGQTAYDLAVVRVGEVPPWMVSPDGCDPDTLRAWERERAEWAAEREGFLDHIEAIDDHLADINNHRRPRWRTDDGWKVCDLIAMRYESGSVNSSWSTAPWRNSMTLSLTWMPADEWRQWVGVELR